MPRARNRPTFGPREPIDNQPIYGPPKPSRRRGPRQFQCSRCAEMFWRDELVIPDGDVSLRIGRRFCKPCYEQMLKGWQRTAGRQDELDRRYRKTYGIGLAQVGAMYAKQMARCAICKNPERPTDDCGSPRLLAVDHDHETGDIRGLLCSTCNTALGLFGDDIRILASAITYLVAAQEKVRG